MLRWPNAVRAVRKTTENRGLLHHHCTNPTRHLLRVTVEGRVLPSQLVSARVVSGKPSGVLQLECARVATVREEHAEPRHRRQLLVVGGKFRDQDDDCRHLRVVKY